MAQTDFTDNVVITGSRDITQLTVKGNTIQTSKLQDWQQSDGTSKASIDNNGNISAVGFTMATGAADGYILQSDACGKSTWQPAFGLMGSSSAVCNGRLTLTSGTPVTTSDVTAATNIYFTPYEGNWVTLYNGNYWANYTLAADISVAVPATTNTNYDVFLYDNAGALTLNTESWNAPDNGSVTSISNASPPVVTVVSHTLSTDQLVTIAGNSVAANNGTWRVGTTTSTTFQLLNLDNTNPAAPGSVGNGGTWQRADQNTARATAIVLQDGVWVKSGAGNSKYRYLGTIRTTGTSGQCEDSLAERFVWNNYNRVLRKLKVIDTTDSWTYATTAWRAGRNTLANRVQMVIGVSKDLVMANVHVHVASTSANAGAAGIGVDSITTNSADLFSEMGNAISTSALAGPSLAHYDGYPGAGYHFLHWIEYRRAGTVTFYGDVGYADVQSGLLAEVLG